jgi:hypothetical protein
VLHLSPHTASCSEQLLYDSNTIEMISFSVSRGLEDKDQTGPCFFLPGGPETFLEVETPSFDDREVPAFVRKSRYGSGCVVVGVQGLDRAGGTEADKLERRFL